MHICVYGYRCARALKHRPKGQWAIYRNQFSPPSIWIQGPELRLTDMAARGFTHSAILIVPILPNFACYTHIFLKLSASSFNSSLQSKNIWDHFIFKTSLLPISFLFVLWLLFLLHYYILRLICLLILNNFLFIMCKCTHVCACAHVPCSTCTQLEVRKELWMWTKAMGSSQSQMWVLGTKREFSRTSKHS